MQVLKTVVRKDSCGYTDFTMSRPPLKPDDRKTIYVRVRVTKAERKRIKTRATAAGAKRESEWIREQLLGGQ